MRDPRHIHIYGSRTSISAYLESVVAQCFNPILVGGGGKCAPLVDFF